jgi:hypothetical protein
MPPQDETRCDLYFEYSFSAYFLECDLDSLGLKLASPGDVGFSKAYLGHVGSFF